MAMAMASWPLKHLSVSFSRQQPMLAFSWQPSMRGCLDIIVLLLNVHFPLKNKELLSQMIYMETILLLAEKQKRELFTVSFKIKIKIKPMPISYSLFNVCSLKHCLSSLPHLSIARTGNGFWDLRDLWASSISLHRAGRWGHDLPPLLRWPRRCLHPCSPIFRLWGKGLELGWMDLHAGPLPTHLRCYPEEVAHPLWACYLCGKRGSALTLHGAALSTWPCAWPEGRSGERWVPITPPFYPSVKDAHCSSSQNYHIFGVDHCHGCGFFSFHVATSMYAAPHTWVFKWLLVELNFCKGWGQCIISKPIHPTIIYSFTQLIVLSTYCTY